MTKKIEAAKLPFDYFVIKCQSPEGAVGLGFLGWLHLDARTAMLVSMTRVPKTVAGFDSFGMQMIGAVPDALHADVKALSQAGAMPSAILKEVASRYRGSIFAAEPCRIDFKLRLSSADEPEKIMSQIMEQAVLLARQEIPAQRAPRRARTSPPKASNALARMRDAFVPMESQLVYCSVRAAPLVVPSQAGI